MPKSPKDTTGEKANKNYSYLSKYEDSISSADKAGKSSTSQGPRPKRLSVYTKGKKRRTRIPNRPKINANLWTIIKGSVGKDMSKIPLPVAFNEPLSLLQRIAESFEYSHLLDKAALSKDLAEQMCYVAAFTVSCYSTVAKRTAKPFNPLLGESYEWDRSEDLGWKLLAEQVSHHPPISAQFCSSSSWKYWELFSMKSKFRGQYMRVQSDGSTRLDFNDGNKYSWNRINTTVNNIIMGKLWIDNDGECKIKNHTNGWSCTLIYLPFNNNNKNKQRYVSGTVKDPEGNDIWDIDGKWDSFIQIKQTNKDDPPKSIWQINEPLQDSDKFYNFTLFACQLNEPEQGVAPTDCRRRPDQRLMEKGDFQEADAVKILLEQKQRSVRKAREEKNTPYNPVWFSSAKDEATGIMMYKYDGKYWDAKKSQDWSKCPDIFNLN